MNSSKISTVSAPAEISAERASSREAAAEFAAELTRVAFAPLAKSLGFYGDSAIAATATSIAKREMGGLTDEFERIIERAK